MILILVHIAHVVSNFNAPMHSVHNIVQVGRSNSDIICGTVRKCPASKSAPPLSEGARRVHGVDKGVHKDPLASNQNKCRRHSHKAISLSERCVRMCRGKLRCAGTIGVRCRASFTVPRSFATPTVAAGAPKSSGKYSRSVSPHAKSYGCGAYRAGHAGHAGLHRPRWGVNQNHPTSRREEIT